MGDRQHWDARYRGTVAQELTWFEASPRRSLGFILERSRPGDSIVDVGAGASTLVDHLLSEHYVHLTLVDLSVAALEVARQRLGEAAAQVKWIAGDVTTWTPPQMYDLWHDRAAFHFLTTEEERDAYRRALLAGLRPGGTLVLGTFAIGGPEKCSGLPVCQYDRAKLEEFLGEQFVCQGALTEDHPTPAGKSQLFHWAVFERRED